MTQPLLWQVVFGTPAPTKSKIMEIDTWGRAQGQQSQSRLTWASGGKLGNQEGVSKIEKRLGRILGFEMYCKWATSHAPPLRPFWSIPKKTNINTVFPILLPDF